MYSRKAALSRAKQYRTCPPPHIVADPAHREAVEKHFAICPYCSQHVAEDQRDWGNLTRHIQQSPARMLPPSSSQDRIIPCQLRHSRSELGDGCEGYFYNPPLVLTLKSGGRHSDEVLVAQTCHEICLAGPGDIILPHARGVADELFAESWNIYTVRATYLDTPVRELAPEIADAVSASGISSSDICPPWAIQPRPLLPHDPRISFRELETRVGGVYTCLK